MGVLVGRLLGWAWRVQWKGGSDSLSCGGVDGLNGGWLGWLTAGVDLES